LLSSNGVFLDSSGIHARCERVPTKFCYACEPVVPVLLLATFLLTFGLLAAAILAAAIKVVCLRGGASAYEVLVRGGALGVLTAVVAFVALGQAGVDLDRRFLGDLLHNGVASVLIGALTGITFVAMRARSSAALTRAQADSR
jgi:hypothetical protein